MMRYLIRISVLSAVMLFAAVFYLLLINLGSFKSYAAVYTINPKSFCGITLSFSESPGCTANPDQATNTSASSYQLTVNITANGSNHKVTYTSWTNFCKSGTFASCNGYKCCIDNDQQTTTTVQIPAGKTTTLQLKRTSPGGACGSYQMDFNVDAVDGSNKCQYGSGNNNIGGTGICQTLHTCNGSGPTPTPSSGGTFTGVVFMDYNQDGQKQGNEPPYTLGAKVKLDWKGHADPPPAITDGSGVYTFSNLVDGNYCASLVAPSGYVETDATLDPACFSVSGNTVRADFGIIASGGPTPPPSQNGITGTLFVDTNSDKKFDNGESPYNGPAQQVEVTNQPGTPAFDTIYTLHNGFYDTGAVLPAGSYTVAYIGALPGGYFMTEPVNAIPPSFGVSVGSICSVGGSPDGVCTSGSISGLNFGISNTKPWMQSFCGDMRIDTGISDAIPDTPVCGSVSGAYAIQTNSSCANPGIAFSGNQTADFNQGSASMKNWIAGDSLNPEIYKPDIPGVIKTSYTYLLDTAKQAGIVPKDLSKFCSLSNCDISTLSHGLYQANGPLTLAKKDIAIPSGDNLIILVAGNVSIRGGISLPVGATLMLSSSGDMHVDPAVGEGSNTSTTGTIEGIYSADGSFILDGNGIGSCTDKRFNIAGGIVVNAAEKGGTFDYSQRDLCSADANCPVVSFIQRPDLIFNMPAFVKHTASIFQELAP